MFIFVKNKTIEVHFCTYGFSQKNQERLHHFPSIGDRARKNWKARSRVGL